MNPFAYVSNAVVVVVGVGLMGQDFARTVLKCLDVKKLILVDKFESIKVSGVSTPLAEFGQGLDSGSTEIVTLTVDIADENAVGAIYDAAGDDEIHYLVITSGISPSPRTDPLNVTAQLRQEVMEANAYGPMNVVHEGLRRKAFALGARCSLLLSTAATNTAEGRANYAYCISKAALRQWMKAEAWQFATNYSFVVNGVSPNPLEGPMATGDQEGAARVADVTAKSPTGLTTPADVTATILFQLSSRFNGVGKDIVLDGGYCLPHAYHGALPGSSTA